MKRRENGRRAEPAGDWVGGMCALLRGGALAGAVCILALLLGAVLISAGVARESWMSGMVLAACVLGALAGGLSAGRRLAGSGLLSGLGVGAVLFLLLLTAGLLAFEDASLERGGLPILCACLCGGGLAGLLSRRKPKKKRKR